MNACALCPRDKPCGHDRCGWGETTVEHDHTKQRGGGVMGEVTKLGGLLRVLRGDKTIRDIELITGMSNAFYSQIETGKAGNISVDAIKKLYVAFPNHKKQILAALELL